MYLPVKLHICSVSSFDRNFSIWAWRGMTLNCGRVSSPASRKEITWSWYLGPGYQSWVIMAKTKSIRRSKQSSIFMYVMSLTCDFGILDEGVVSSLTIWTQNSLDFFCFLEDLGWASSGIIMEDISWWSSLKDLYGVQIFFVYKYW